MPETSEVEQTVRGLDEDTIYDIKVAAKYEGGKLGPQSDVARVKTKKTTSGKCWEFVTEAPEEEEEEEEEILFCLTINNKTQPII